MGRLWGQIASLLRALGDALHDGLRAQELGVPLLLVVRLHAAQEVLVAAGLAHVSDVDVDPLAQLPVAWGRRAALYDEWRLWASEMLEPSLSVADISCPFGRDIPRNSCTCLGHASSYTLPSNLSAVQGVIEPNCISQRWRRHSAQEGEY